QPQRHRRILGESHSAPRALRGNGSRRRGVRIPPVKNTKDTEDTEDTKVRPAGVALCPLWPLCRASAADRRCGQDILAFMLKNFVVALVALALAAPAMAQSQAINGTIEGTVSDTSGAVLPG